MTIKIPLTTRNCLRILNFFFLFNFFYFKNYHTSWKKNNDIFSTIIDLFSHCWISLYILFSWLCFFFKEKTGWFRQCVNNCQKKTSKAIYGFSSRVWIYLLIFYFYFFENLYFFIYIYGGRKIMITQPHQRKLSYLDF